MSDEQDDTVYQITRVEERGGIEETSYDKTFVQAPSKEDVLELYNEAMNQE